jgi:hypothetical protein
MRFFSKRNKDMFDERRVYGANSLVLRREDAWRRRRRQVLNSECRNRLLAQIKFVVSTQDFLEKYILVEDKGQKVYFVNDQMFNDFAVAELGYKFSDFINLRTFEFKETRIEPSHDSEADSFYDDHILFDLIETIVLFTKKEKREDVIQRLNTIFKEERIEYSIKESLITKDTGDDLKNIANQLKDEKLQRKIKSYFDLYKNNDYLNAAKVSADIVGIIFSNSDGKKVRAIDSLCKKVALRIVANSEKKDVRISEMTKMVREQLGVVNQLNNSVFDIRHSEDNRVRVKSDYVYKSVCMTSIALIELVLVTLKDDFIVSNDWEEQKKIYTEKYRINRDVTYFIPAPTTSGEPPPDDIPF